MVYVFVAPIRTSWTPRSFGERVVMGVILAPAFAVAGAAMAVAATVVAVVAVPLMGCVLQYF